MEIPCKKKKIENVQYKATEEQTIFLGEIEEMERIREEMMIIDREDYPLIPRGESLEEGGVKELSSLMPQGT